jgi:hypothetical protein
MATDDRAFAMTAYDSHDGLRCLNLSSGGDSRAVDDWMFHAGGPGEAAPIDSAHPCRQ